MLSLYRNEHFLSPLIIAAQTFLPPVLYSTSRDDGKKDNSEFQMKPEVIDAGRTVSSFSVQNRAFALLKRIILLSCVSAFGCAFLSRFIIMNCGSMFTNDATITHLLSLPQNITFMMCSIFIQPITMVFEGALIAARDLRFLVTAYGITMTALVSLLRYASPNFSGVWKSLLLFQVIRFTLFGSRVFRRYHNRGNDRSTSTI